MHSSRFFASSFFRGRLASHFFTAAALCLIPGWLVPSVRAETIALGSFAHSDFERNDPVTTVALATTIQAGLDANARWKFVDRAETARIFDELGLSQRGFVSADTAARVGKLLRADLLLSGTIFTPKNAKPYIILETDELIRAEPIALARVELGNVLEKGHLTLPSPADLKRIVEAGAHLLDTASAQLAAQRNRTILKLLFLTNKTGDLSLSGLERMLAARMEQSAAAGGTHRLLRLDRPEIATHESELALLGLVEADGKAWSQVADYYLWGSYQIANNALTLTLTLWDGQGPPQELKETASPQEAFELTSRLAQKIIATAVPVNRQSDVSDLGIDQRKKVAALLVQEAKAVRLATIQPTQQKEAIQAAQAEKRRLLVAAVFFSPADKESWINLLELRVYDADRAANLSAMLSRVGDLEYELEVAERFLLSPDGQIDLRALLGVIERFDGATSHGFRQLLSDFDDFDEDLNDVFVGRNLLALKARVTASYRTHVMQLGRLLARAAPGQDDDYRQAAECVLTTALHHPFTNEERKVLIDLLWPRLKIDLLVHRAWYPNGDRTEHLDALMWTYYADRHQMPEAEGLNVLSNADLVAALAVPAPAGSPAWEKLRSIERGKDQLARVQKAGPNGRASPNNQRYVEQQQRTIDTEKNEYAALQIRAAAFLRSHSEAGKSMATNQDELLRGPVDREITFLNPPLETYPPAVRKKQAAWLRSIARQRTGEGYPQSVLDRLHAKVDALERESVSETQTGPSSNSAPWDEAKSTYLDPEFGGFLLATYAKHGDLPSLEALLTRGTPIEAAGEAVVEGIRGEQWPAVYYLFGRGYDPAARWPDMNHSVPNPTHGDHPGRVALAAAAIKGRVDVVDLLIKKGVRFAPDSESGRYAVVELVKSHRLALLKQMLAAGAEPGGHLQQELAPLYYAIHNHDLDALKLLLGAGVDPTADFGGTLSRSGGLTGNTGWDQYDLHLILETALGYCARENWLEGAQALLSVSRSDLSKELLKDEPHHYATNPAVRAVFLRAELQAAAPSPANDRGGIDLFTAIAAGDQRGFAAALSRPESLSFRGRSGETALMFALDEKAHAFARQLMTAGASLAEFDRIGSTPLCYAARNGDIELAEQMVRQGADINLSRGRANRPLDQAIMEGHSEAMVLKLLKLGASHAPHPTKVSVIPLFQATASNMPEVVRELVRSGDDPNRLANGFPIFFPAARSNNPELIQFYFNLRCDLNRRSENGWTPLMTAVRWGTSASVRKLLELGLRDPEAASLAVSMMKDLEPQNRPDPAELRALPYRPDYRRCLELMEEFGQIAQSEAAQENIFWRNPHSIAEIEAHLTHGGDVNYVGTMTPLQYETMTGQTATVAFLLGRGADPKRVGTGSTPFADSALVLSLQHPAMAELLLKYGANPNEIIKNSGGWSILTAASFNAAVPVETIRLLLRYGANSSTEALDALQEYPVKNDPRVDEVRAVLRGK